MKNFIIGVAFILGLITPSSTDVSRPEDLARWISDHCIVELNPYEERQLHRSKDGFIYTAVVCNYQETYKPEVK